MFYSLPGKMANCDTSISNMSSFIEQVFDNFTKQESKVYKIFKTLENFKTYFDNMWLDLLLKFVINHK